MYGAGNIGRGFIGMILSQAGYEVRFVDVADAVVERLRREHRYPVRIVSDDGHEDVMVEHVSAVDGKDPEAVAKAIAEADIMATAVGVNVLKFIAPNIAAGLRARFASTDHPLDIIICENLMDANLILAGMVKAYLTPEEFELLDSRVGFVEASIGRMVPVQTPEMQDGDPLRVCVERYAYLPVDKDALKGDIPDIFNLVPASPFDFYIKRKLYVHNMGHATCAYLGMYLGKEYICEAIDDEAVRCIVKGAMEESALALSSCYSVSLGELLLHIDDLLSRFTNTALKDTCARVGGDPARKLSPADRMIGAAQLCIEQGVEPAYICIGIAGGLLQYMQNEKITPTEANARKVLSDVSGLDGDSSLMQGVLSMFFMYLDESSAGQMRRFADRLSAEKRVGVI